jgi:acetate---CoA ligase (ADP-forming)
MSGSPATLARLDSAADGLRALFEPRSVAVIGASRRRGTVGAEVLHNLLAAGFTGTVIPINPRATTIESLPAFARVTAVRDPIDLAIVAVPAAEVPAVIDDCIAKNVGAIVVLTAGFGELGDDGRAREAVLRDRVRRAGVRMVGPNCLGVVSTNPTIRLNATFSPVFPPRGPIAFSSQSGALGLAILEHARQLNLGISCFVSVGNKADVSTNDLIEYWADDPRTWVILLYVESFGNPKRFRQIARRAAKRKPIVAVKAGRSASGARAASSHTGAMTASDRLVDALLRDAGVLRTETLEELFDAAQLLAHQPVPRGPRTAILTNAGGPGILAADACEALGLRVTSLSRETTDRLRLLLPPTASLANPIDMIATATADHYRRALPMLLRDPNVDNILVMYTRVLADSGDVARAIREAARGSWKPVLATFFGTDAAAALSPVPCYTFPESSVRALAHAVAYARWRTTVDGVVPTFTDLDAGAAAHVIERARASTCDWLSQRDGLALLTACRIPVVATDIVRSADDAAAAAGRIGYPVVLKGSGARVLHKTEAHLVRRALDDEGSVREAYAALSAHPDVTDVVVQKMIAGAVEMLVGATRDDRFGHAVICGSGGTLVELLHDSALRLTPLTDQDAVSMLNEIRGVQLLRGFRGAPSCDEAALRDIVLRVSALVEACPAIAEIDLNPVMVTPDGASVVDARIRVNPTPV